MGIVGRASPCAEVLTVNSLVSVEHLVNLLVSQNLYKKPNCCAQEWISPVFQDCHFFSGTCCFKVIVETWITDVMTLITPLTVAGSVLPADSDVHVYSCFLSCKVSCCGWVLFGNCVPECTTGRTVKVFNWKKKKEKKNKKKKQQCLKRKITTKKKLFCNLHFYLSKCLYIYALQTSDWRAFVTVLSHCGWISHEQLQHCWRSWSKPRLGSDHILNLLFTSHWNT